jgi:hypothetical protein
MVRPNRSKAVDFLFSPALSGPFEETLEITNVSDPFNNQTVKVKAFVRAPSSFFVTSIQLAFGSVTLGEASVPQRIVLVNTSKQKRSFEIMADTTSFERCAPTLAFQALSTPAGGPAGTTAGGGGGGDSSEREVLERRLRIALRKRQVDKIEALSAQLGQLRAAEDTTGAANGGEVRLDPSDPRWRPNSLTVTVDAGAILTVLVMFIPLARLGFSKHFGEEDGDGVILIGETKNLDQTTKVTYSAEVRFRDRSSALSLRAHASQSAASKPAGTGTGSALAKQAPQLTALDPAGSIIVTPAKVDLGEVFIGSEASAFFNISSTSLYAIQYTIEQVAGEAQLRLSSSWGFVNPGSRRRIQVSFTPKLSGMLNLQLLVKNRAAPQDVSSLLSPQRSCTYH